MRSTVQKRPVIPKVRCEVFRKSLRYSGPHIWNQLRNELHHIKSLPQFKKSRKQHFRAVPEILLKGGWATNTFVLWVEGVLLTMCPRGGEGQLVLGVKVYLIHSGAG